MSGAIVRSSNLEALTYNSSERFLNWKVGKQEALLLFSCLGYGRMLCPADHWAIFPIRMRNVVAFSLVDPPGAAEGYSDEVHMNSIRCT